jgi:hypothetical protein
MKQSDKDKLKNIDLEKTLNDLEAFRINAHKQIDENPFIMKKMDIFWRLAAWQAGVKNPRSQADYMKDEIDTMARDQKERIIENYAVLSQSKET